MKIKYNPSYTSNTIKVGCELHGSGHRRVIREHVRIGFGLHYRILVARRAWFQLFRYITIEYEVSKKLIFQQARVWLSVYYRANTSFEFLIFYKMTKALLSFIITFDVWIYLIHVIECNVRFDKTCNECLFWNCFIFEIQNVIKYYYYVIWGNSFNTGL